MSKNHPKIYTKPPALLPSLSKFGVYDVEGPLRGLSNHLQSLGYDTSMWHIFKEVTYEAVFISKLTCQLSSFFVQNFVQTTSTLCKQRQLCAKNDDHFVQTTTTLQGQRPLCTNNDDFVQTTTTLQGQRQLCQKLMYDPMKSPEYGGEYWTKLLLDRVR